MIPLEEKSEDHKAFRIHPLRTMNICTRFNGKLFYLIAVEIFHGGPNDRLSDNCNLNSIYAFFMHFFVVAAVPWFASGTH